MADESQSIGTARVDLEVNTAQLEPAINLAKTRLTSLSTDAQKQYATLNKAEQRRVENLLNQANTLGLSKDQQLAYNAALKTEGALLDEVTQKIARNSAATKANADQNFRTQKQVEAALRGTPAQLTDIFVSLQGGQAPLTVLLQQGGQLKDMFGGITPAARALGSTLMGLVNPATLATGALAAVGVAALQGSKEMEGYQKAIALSGNRIGVTVSSLARDAEGISEKTGQSVSSLAAALSTLAQGGATTRDQLGAAASAAVAFEKATGQAVDKTADAFKSIQEGPVKAIEKLNAQYNFLTPNIYRQIRALEESGDKAGAARLATEQYINALSNMSKEVQSSAGILERSWNAITGAAKSAWDAMLGLGRASTPQEQLNRLQQQLAQLESSGPIMGRGADRGVDVRARMIEQTKTAIAAAQGRVDAENKSAEAAKKNAEATDKTIKSLDDAAKNATKHKKSLDELTQAYITQAEQVLGLKSLDEQALEATNARNDALQKQAEAYRDLLDPTRKLHREIEDIQRLVEAGALTPDEGVAAEVKKLGDFYNKAEKNVSDLDMFSKRAARNIQDSFADFLFDPFAKGTEGMLESFANMIRRMAAEATAAQLGKALFGDQGGGDKGLIDAFIKNMTGGGSGSGTATGYDTGAVDLGGSISDYLGSFASGIDYIPRDGYARLHRGERVMTAAENAKNGGGFGNVTINNYAGETVTQKQTENDQGGMDLEIMVGQMVSDQIASYGKPGNKSVRQTFGLAPALARRG